MGLADMLCMPDGDYPLNVDSLLLIVVGAHLQAEAKHRYLAYDLCERICGAKDQSNGESVNGSGITPLVCTDVWYLNNHELLARPVISIGDPAVNAATAYLSTRLPTALVIDDMLRVQLDPEWIECQACLWGVNAASTASAVEVFAERYLGEFLRQAAERAE